MKKNILLVAIMLFITFSATSLMAAPPANSITTWRGNQPGALSLIFDDGYLTQSTFAVPALNARGFRGTFFIITGRANWNWWIAAANAGHEIGAHTVTHPDLTTLSAADAENEIATSQATINTHITNQKCVTFAYPYGALNTAVEALAQKYFIGARGVVNGLNNSSTDLYNEFGYDVTYDTVSQMENLTVQAASQGQWLIPIFHSFDPTQYGTWTTDMFLTYMDYLKGRTDLWIAPFGEVIRYMRERSTARISVSSQTSTRITLNLTDSLDNTIFNYPLTLRSVVPVNWNTVDVQQGSNVATLTPVTDQGQWVVFYDAVPNGGTITLSQGSLTPAPVASNDAYSTVVNTSLNVPSPGVLGNDTNPSGATLSAQLVSGTSHGTLALNANGSFSYTPIATYVGSDSFTYMANDVTNNSNAATVTITMTSTGGVLFSDDFSRAVNAPNPLSPWTVAQGTWQIVNGVLLGSSGPSTYSTIYTSTNPLWTDYSVEGRIQFPAGAFGGGLGGRVNPVNGARYGAWIYPDGSVAGANMLRLVKFRDWTTWNWTAMQQISLPSVGTGWHTLKMAFNGSRIQVYYDGTVMIDVTDNNYDSLAPYLSGGISADMWTNTNPYAMSVENVVVVNASAGALSSLSLNPASVTGGTNSQGTVTLSGPAPSGGAVVSLSSNTTSAATVPASVTIPSGSTSATFTITTTAVTSSIPVTISAAYGGVIKAATLAVNQASNLPPVAVNDAYSTNANTALNQTAPGVLNNDTDPQGATLTAQLVSSPSHGTLALNADGSFSYTPIATYVGSDKFTYMAKNGTTNSNIATVTITVLSTSGVLFSDDFTRSPNAPDPLSPWVNTLGTWTVTNGVLQGSSTPSTYASIYTSTNPLWSDYTVEGRLQFPAGAFGGGLGGRVNPANGARYGAWIYPDGSAAGSNMLRLVKFRDWTTWNWTAMQQISLPSVGTGWHTLKMAFIGSRIQVYYDGTLMIDTTDNNYDSLAPYLSGGISADLWTYTAPYAMSVENIVVVNTSQPGL